PEVAQDSVLPWRSVIVMIVLLKEAWMCAMPSSTFLRAFFGFFADDAADFCSAMLIQCLLDGSCTTCRPSRQVSRPACAGPCGCARWCGCAGRASAGPCGGARPARCPDPSVA